jgi:hypothetical protein
MVSRKFFFVIYLLCGTAGIVAAQTVEKSSVSFSFPTQVEGVANGAFNQRIAASFKVIPLSAAKGKFALAWNVSTPATSGSLTIYSVAGKTVTKISLSKKAGIVECDLGKAADGVYFAALSYGSFKQTIKLALYR